MSRTTLSLTCLLWLTLVGAAAAQPNLNDPGASSLQDFSGGVTLGGSYFQVQNISGDGVGYRNGFTQIGHMLPFWIDDNFVIASNNRLMITDTQQVGGTFGAFGRYYLDDQERIYGANLYYDIDQSLANNGYEQVGVGIETLGQWWDFRANGYAPTKQGNNFLGAVSISNVLAYSGHRVGLLGTGSYEETLAGADFEFGVPLTSWTPWLRGYAGMYFYDATADDPVGFRGRVEGWVSDDLNLGVQVTEDQQFGTNVNATVNFLFSGWKPTRYFPNFTTRERMLIPVQRNWRVATGKYEQTDLVAAINPRTDQPYFIDWVDNSSLAPGDGTYENPFTALPASAPNADLILVRVGATTPGTPLSGSITLNDFQRMLGEGREHEFSAYFNYGQLAIPTQTYNLPEFINSGVFPSLTSNANVITIANNNEVSAFNLVNATGAGITNIASGSHNFNLNNLNLTDNAGGGILLRQASGLGLITTVAAVNNAAGGIGIDSGAPLVLNMTDIISFSNPAGTQRYGISVNADDAEIYATLTNVVASQNEDGIILSETNTGMTALLQNVFANGNVAGTGLGDGIRAVGNGGYMNLTYTGVTANENEGRGMAIEGDSTYIWFVGSNLTGNLNGGDNFNVTLLNSSELYGSVQNAQFNESQNGSGIVVDTDASFVGTANSPFLFDGVSADGNFLDGFRSRAVNASYQSLRVGNSTFNDNLQDGISTILAGGSAVGLFVELSESTLNQRDGFHMEVQDASQLVTYIDQSTLSDNDRSAVFGIVDVFGSGNSVVRLSLTDTPGANSGADGLYIQSDNGADIGVTATDGSFADSGRLTPGSSALRFEATDSVINLALTRTPGNNTNLYPAGPQEFGLFLNLDSSFFNGTVIDGDFSNNIQYGIVANATNGTFATLSMLNVPVDGNGIDGAQVNVTNGSVAALNAYGTTSFSDNGLSGAGSGLNLFVDGTAAPSQLTVNLEGTAVNNNFDTGLFGTANGTAVNNGILQIRTSAGTTFDGNGLDGVTLVNNAGVVDALFTDTNMTSNLQDGVDYFGAGQGAQDSHLEFVNTGVNGFLGLVDNNGGDGLEFTVSAGNRLNVAANSVSFSNNGERGIDGLVMGPGSSVGLVNLLQVTGDFNQLEGLKLVADDSGNLLGNVNGGSFSNNDPFGLGLVDGVNIVADNSATALICFDGTVVDFNTGNGFNLAAHNNASLNVALWTSGNFGTLSASNNGLQAVVFTLDSGATGNLMMDGENVFNGNGAATAISYTATNANQAAFVFSGTSDNNADDAINVQMTNVNEAYIDIHGPGSLNGNGSNGIDIALNNVTFGSSPLNILFPQGNFTANPFNISDITISGNGDEGIRIVGNNVTLPAGSNATITSVDASNNGVDGTGDGIFINLTGGGAIDSLVIDQVFADSNAGKGLNFSATGGYVIGTLAVTNGSYSSNFGNAGDGDADGIRLNFAGGSIDELDVSGNTASFNQGFGLGDSALGINVIANGTPINTLTFDGNTVEENEGVGIQLTAAASPVTTLTISDNLIHGNQGDGVNLNLTGSNVTNLVVTGNDIGRVDPLPLLGFSIDFNNEHVNHLNLSENGIFIESILYDFSPIGYSIATTRGAGEVFENIFGAVETGFFAVNGNPIDVNAVAQPGVVNDGDTLMTLQFNDFENTDGSLHVDFVVGDAAAAAIQTGTDLAGVEVTAFFSNGESLFGIFGPTALQTFTRASVPGLQNQGDGIHIEQVNSNIGNALFDDNNISDNIGDGIDFNVVTNSNIGPVIVSNNTIDGNGGDGVRLLNPTTPVNNLSFTFTDNTSISGNGGNGVNFEISNGQALALTMTGNTVDTNTGMGVRAVISGTSSINAILGSTAAGANPNTFNGNGDAGVGIVMSGTTTGSLAVTNSSFNNNIDGASAAFAGVGLGVSMSGAATLDPVVIGDAGVMNTTFNGNASHGLQLTMSGTSSIPTQLQLLNLQANENVAGDGVHIALNGAATLPDLLVVGTETGASFNGNGGDGFFLSTNGTSSLGTAHLQDVTANENTGDGVQFFRQGASSMPNVTIDNANLVGNTENGLNITIGDQNFASTFVVTNSTMNDNDASGVLLRTIGDADLNITIHDSEITQNGLHGIRAFSTFGATDTPTVTVDFQRNDISDNTGSGIDVATTLFGLINNNEITDNTVDGIHTTIGGNVTITNNLIQGNDDDGIDMEVGSVTQTMTVLIQTNDILDNGDDGVALRVLERGNLSANVFDNLIMDNGGDGIQLAATSTGVATVNTFVDIELNDIISNDGRGINIVNGGGTSGTAGSGTIFAPSDMTVFIDNDNTIAENGLEGIYVVNTSSTTQGNEANIDNLATAAMLEDGSVFAKPLLSLFIDGNDVNSNGQSNVAGNFIDGAGLVLRVGSSDATTSFTDPGGTATGGRAGVLATITDNDFFGNFASDVTFAPFISTVDPATTAGTWTDNNNNPRDPADDVFTVDSYQSDPLARLDLIFNDNRGNAMISANTTASTAFYNNDESVFKSRTVNQDGNDPPFPPVGPDDNGPFNSGTRARNATRQAFRGSPFAAPTLSIVGTSGNSDNFLYPGVAPNSTPQNAANRSTFRIQSGFSNTFGIGNTFNGGIPIGGDTGELPFIWGTF